MLTIDLVRHAESEWVQRADASPIPLFGGRMNSVDLSTIGERQATSLGVYARDHDIRPTDFVTSPAKRAKRTHRVSADAMGRRGVRALVRRDWQELSWGRWEGGPRDVRNKPPFREQRERLGFDFAPPGGESYRQVRLRAQAELREIAHRVRAGHVWVHTHRNVIKAVCQPWFGWTLEEMTQASLDVVSLTRLRLVRGEFQLVFYNQATLA